MDSKTTWDVIKELLHSHDCVIVPGFGGFVCNREPSRIDQVSHLITPPAKRVVFNQNLKSNDGLLAGSMAARLQIPYADAISLIESTVQHTRGILQEKKQMAIELFGTFRLNADANYVFLPDRHNNFLNSSYGLMPIQASTVASRTIRSPRARVFKDRKDVKSARPRRKIFSGAAIVTATLTILLFVNGFIFLKDHRMEDLRISSMNIAGWFDSVFHSTPAQPQENSVADMTAKSPVADPGGAVEVGRHISGAGHATPYVEGQNADTAASEWSTDRIIALTRNIAAAPHASPFGYAPAADAAEGIIAPEPENAGHTLRPNTAVSPSDSAFYVIGGVFCRKGNAKKYFHELETKGYQPVIVENADIHCNRVSYGIFSSRKEANALLAMLHSGDNPGAWLLPVKAR